MLFQVVSSVLKDDFYHKFYVLFPSFLEGCFSQKVSSYDTCIRSNYTCCFYFLFVIFVLKSLVSSGRCFSYSVCVYVRFLGVGSVGLLTKLPQLFFRDPILRHNYPTHVRDRPAWPWKKLEASMDFDKRDDWQMPKGPMMPDCRLFNPRSAAFEEEMVPCSKWQSCITLQSNTWPLNLELPQRCLVCSTHHLCSFLNWHFCSAPGPGNS